MFMLFGLNKKWCISKPQSYLQSSYVRQGEAWLWGFFRTVGWDLAGCGWDLAQSGWDLAQCGWDLAQCGWDLAECEWDLAECVWDLAECRWDLAECGRDLADCGWDLAECGWDLAECFECLAANAKVTTVLGSPQHPPTQWKFKFESRRMKQCWKTYSCYRLLAYTNQVNEVRLVTHTNTKIIKAATDTILYIAWPNEWAGNRQYQKTGPNPNISVFRAHPWDTKKYKKGTPPFLTHCAPLKRLLI